MSYYRREIRRMVTKPINGDSVSLQRLSKLAVDDRDLSNHWHNC